MVNRFLRNSLLGGGGMLLVLACIGCGGSGSNSQTSSLPPPVILTGSTSQVEHGKVAFVQSHNAQSYLCVIMIGAASSGQVLTAAGTTVADPVLSPDGTKIAYASNGINVISADGTGTVQQITTNPNDVQPAWSPDGTTLGWTRQAGGDTSASADMIYTELLSSGTAQPLSDSTGTPLSDVRNPCWDPNTLEHRIAYTTRQNGTGAVTIYRVADTGGTAVAIATLPSSNLAIDHISWSAQEVLAFGVYDETQPTAVGSIYTVSAAGGVPTLFISGSSDNGGPAWSPTGNQLVFYSNRGGNYQLFVAEASSGQIVQLTNDTADDGVPSWSLRLSRRLQARELH